MAVLSEQIASRTKGPMAENEDWWRLCYETETSHFFIEHDWSYTSIGALKTNSGSARYEVEGWTGHGANKIAEARAKLLERAKG